jgi:hypothetical protein
VVAAPGVGPADSLGLTSGNSLGSLDLSSAPPTATAATAIAAAPPMATHRSAALSMPPPKTDDFEYVPNRRPDQPAGERIVRRSAVPDGMEITPALAEIPGLRCRVRGTRAQTLLSGTGSTL